MFTLGGGDPGAYSMPVKQFEEPRQRPMFMPGTVHHATEVADIKELDKLCLAGKENGYHESVTLQEKEELLGMMPIHVACEKGHIDVVQYLIKKRVDLDAGDKYRVTALHLAAIENREEVVRLLLQSRADCKQPDTEGDLPLHWAATKGHTQVATLLIKAGSPVDPINKQCWTPLHRAAYNGRREMCVVLVNAGASLAARNKDGNTALHLAAFMNQLNTMETLLGLSARTDLVNVSNKLPLDLCITDAAREIIALHTVNPKYGGAAADAAKAAKGNAAAAPVATHVDDYDGDRNSARMDTTKLTQALRSKQAAAEDFPDMDDHHHHHRQAADEGEEKSLYLRAGGSNAGRGASEFLSEASIGFDDRANPYSMGYQNMGEGGERTSSGSMSQRTSMTRRPSGLGAPRASIGALGDPGERSSAGSRAARGTVDLTKRPSAAFGASGGLGDNAAAARRASLLQERSSNAAMVGAGGAGSPTALRARASVPSSASAGLAGWEGADRISAAEYQQRAKEENRRSAAAGASSGLLGPAGGQLTAAGAAGAAGAGPVRPVSGNKRFLAQYNLDKLNLFAP